VLESVPLHHLQTSRDRERAHDHVVILGVETELRAHSGEKPVEGGPVQQRGVIMVKDPGWNLEVLTHFPHGIMGRGPTSGKGCIIMDQNPLRELIDKGEQ